MESNKKWIIRDSAGRISGPFTTEKILYSIGRGEFSGDEHVSFYPGGKWIPMSQDPQFYDKLLEVLSDNVNVEASPQTRVLEFTKPQSDMPPTPPKKEKSKATPEPKAKPPEDDADEFQIAQQTALPLEAPADPSAEEPEEEDEEAPKKKKRKKKEPEDIELVDTQGEFSKQFFGRAKLPLIILVVGGLLAYVLNESTGSTEKERIHLLAPQKNQPQQPSEKLTPRIKGAIAAFLKDSFDGYSKAQNEMVYVIEHNNRNAEGMALLCMTYFQLWPYAFQDSQDSKTVATVVQMASSVDPAGPHSATCRAVDLIVRARYQEAKNLVEAMLDMRSANDRQPPIIFYFLKGYLLEGSGDHVAAISYLKSAQQLWPQWLLPYVLEAQAQGKIDNSNDAAILYRKVLEANPLHRTAQIELGLLEYKAFNRYPQGEQYLNSGLTGDFAAPRPVMARGYFGLAEIALKRNDNAKALKFAEKSYAMSAAYAPAKNLIRYLGGDLKKNPPKGWELVFEGDQYMREGDFHAAQAHYKAAFELDSKNAVAAMRAAQCLWKLSFSTEAIDWLDKAIKSDPKLIEAYVTLADYQAQRYNFLGAAKVLNQARVQNPKSHEVYRGYAAVELRRGDATSALNFGKKALSLYENDVETQIILAQATAALKDFRMSYNYAAKAVEIDVNDRKAQIAYGEALAGLQGVDVGVDHLTKMVNNYPAVMDYRLALGRMYLADERYNQSEEIFRQVIALDKDGKPKEAYVELAKVLRAQGNSNEALDLLLKAAVLDPADAEPLYIAGAIYMDTKKPQEAINLFSRVLVINNLYPLTHYQMGRAYMLMRDFQEALRHAAEEKRINPNLADAFILAAEAQAELNQFTMCANEYQKALKLRPQPAAIYVRLAQCYRKASNLDVAISMLAVASTKESGNADIYKEQGAIYEMKGDGPHAVEAYNQYLALNPDAQDKAAIEKRISALQRGQTP